MNDNFPPPAGIKPDLPDVGTLLREQLSQIRRALATLLVGRFLKQQPQMLDELINATVAEILKKSEQYDPERPFVPWVLGFARNILKERLRQDQRNAQRVSYSGNLEMLLDSKSRQDSIERRMDLQSYLDQISPAESRLLQLRYWEKMTSSEIAQETGAVTPNAVRIQLTRALEKLRVLMTRSEGEN